MESERVEREIELPASTTEVWEQVADGEHLGDWLDAEIELELRPGGSATFRFAEGELRRGLVRDVDEGRRLAFTWWPLTGEDVGRATTVTITIEPAGAGSRLRLIESAPASSRALAGAVA
jgi:uncharacterized protein YndB with AHSA1/START domain